MASVPVMFLLFLKLLAVAVRTQQKDSNLIGLDSSLSPTTQPTSWLSPSRLFAFGFYPQGNGFAVGIWLVGQSESTVVWTANRDDPPVSSNATLHFTKDGNLLLRTDQGQEKPVVKLEETAVSASMLDSGNFVFYNKTSHAIWESFNSPTDTILGGQNLSVDQNLVSSASTSNHSSGRFLLAMQGDGNLVAYPVNSLKKVEDSYWSSNTQGVLGSFPVLNLNNRGLLCLQNSAGLNVQTVAQSSYSGKNKTIIYRATLDADGVFRMYSHSFEVNDKSTISLEWQSLQNQCVVSGLCGFNSFCSRTGNKVKCSCFPGFTSVSPDMEFLDCYRSFNDEDDCIRKEPPLYHIITFNITTLGGGPYSVLSMNEDDCRKSCQNDCNCGVALHSNGICSKRKLPIIYGKVNQNETETAMAFFKVSARDYNPTIPGRTIPGEQIVTIDSKKELIVILSVSLGSITFVCSLMALFSFFIYRRRVHRYKRLQENSNLSLIEEFTLQSFSYKELEKATDGFKEELGRGSFGAVYKGCISVGNKIVAVKRLEKVVEEGEREFRAEITSIGQTHHRNLVRLLGFCMEGSRKLLVYEYMCNGSLADLLFKVERRPIWKERVRIALDVARGILYLHEECEAPIIHCDIKPQNILIDDSWKAKISDFGLARFLMPNRSETITSIRGTGGYLAPEWQKNTLISVKADVYSFGIVLLEIVCCRSNMEVNVSTPDEVLLTSWVYDCFVAGELDKLVGDEEVEMRTLERMVKVGLLCIQDDPFLRPSMMNVILMLEGTMDIPVPPSPTPCLLIY